MKLNKKLILSVSVIAVLATGAVSYAALNKQEKVEPKPVASIETKPEVKTEEVAPVEVTPEVQTVQEPVETVVEPPKVRTFDEIIMDYPNMSSIPGLIECSGYLKTEFPEWFQDHNREQNIKWIAETYASSCTTIDTTPVRRQMKNFNTMINLYGVR